MPFLRLTRDARGYETTALLHSSHPGEEPRVLYWYRTAPGVRIGRPALDEEAIRSIEDRHPDIDFDWPHIIEVGATLVPEVEPRRERPRRRQVRPTEDATPAVQAVATDSGDTQAMPAGSPETTAPVEPPTTDASPGRLIEKVAAVAALPPSGLLDELVGREIAARLRDRYADVVDELRTRSAPGGRAAWQARADALDPDRWATPEEVLRGVEQADRLLDELRRDFA